MYANQFLGMIVLFIFSVILFQIFVELPDVFLNIFCCVLFWWVIAPIAVTFLLKSIINIGKKEV